jgi:elongation factor P
MSTISAGNISKNIFVIFKGSPYRVAKTEFMAPGKGSAVMRCRLQSVQTGNVQDFTYKTGETVEVADVEKLDMQYLYQDADDYVFMDPRTYEQVSVPSKLIADKAGYLIPELKATILMFEEQPIGVQVPPHISLKVTEAEDAVAGNRVNAPKKEVVVETGLKVQVPLFIKTGDTVMLDTETGDYLSRVN